MDRNGQLAPQLYVQLKICIRSLGAAVPQLARTTPWLHKGRQMQAGGGATAGGQVA